MSMDTCKSCGSPVDTDDDTDCYARIGFGDDGAVDYDGPCRCESCRESERERNAA